MVSEFVVDDAVKAEIERLSTRNKNQCERLDQQIKHNADLLNRNAKLQAVVDALKEVHGWDTISPRVTTVVAALEVSDEL